MPYAITVTNRKGGVGKTTTVHSLAHALAEEGKSVLMMDLDSQGNLSRWLDVPEGVPTLAEVARGQVNFGEIIYPVNERLDVVPGSARLAECETVLEHNETLPQMWLRRQLGSLLGAERWDFVLLDTSPSLNLLTLASIIAADGLLLPLEPAPLALEGLAEMLRRAEQAREIRPELSVLGVVLTRYDGRQRTDRDALEMVKKAPGLENALVATVRGTVRMTEAPGRRRSIFEYAPGSTAAADYRHLAREVLARVA